MKRIKNSKGTVWYGMHFYPGVAEYSEPGKEPYRVYLNENTIRAMDPTFAGRPVFVQHVDEVDANIDSLRKDADGWVIESFFNQADGKHWVKFIVVSEKGERAIKNGMRLSNCYMPKKFNGAGQWNGVTYAREITGGEYEHLAIVPNPRYEESVILTPDQFKEYNESKIVELKRLANNDEGEPMAIKFFKRQKVENSIDLQDVSVVLPKSGREVTITQMVNELDEPKEVKFKVGDEMLTGAELVTRHEAVCNELANAKKDMEEKEDCQNEDDEDEDDMENEDDGDEDDDDKKENDDEEDEADKKKKEKLEKEEMKNKAKNKAKKKNDADELETRRKAKEKADRLRNAHTRDLNDSDARVDLDIDQVARGKSRYGSK